jgi:hypothetical protein
MPIGLALDSTLLGMCFGLFPIVWIVINATFPKYKNTRVAIQHSAAGQRNTPASTIVEHLDDDRAWAFYEKSKRVAVACRATALDMSFYVAILLAFAVARLPQGP